MLYIIRLGHLINIIAEHQVYKSLHKHKTHIFFNPSNVQFDIKPNAM